MFLSKWCKKFSEDDLEDLTVQAFNDLYTIVAWIRENLPDRTRGDRFPPDPDTFRYRTKQWYRSEWCAIVKHLWRFTFTASKSTDLKDLLPSETKQGGSKYGPEFKEQLYLFCHGTHFPELIRTHIFHNLSELRSPFNARVVIQLPTDEGKCVN